MSTSLRELVDEPERRREVPAGELVELLLARIEATAGELNAYITVTADQARADAAATRRAPQPRASRWARSTGSRSR